MSSAGERSADGAGADAVISKPFDLEAMEALVVRWSPAAIRELRTCATTRLPGWRLGQTTKQTSTQPPLLRPRVWASGRGQLVAGRLTPPVMMAE